MSIKDSNMGFWSTAASAIGGLFGLGGNLFQSSNANKWNQKQLDTMIAENEKNRQFNHNESMAARQFQANFAREMYDKQVKNNSIQNQIAQMRSAGVNPALAYSSNSFAPASASSVSAGGASSSGSVSPTQYSTTDMASPALSTARQVAEIANIEAQTKKISSETDILRSDASVRDAWNQGLIQLQGLQIIREGIGARIDDNTAAKLRVELNLLQKRVDNFDKQMKLVDSQIQSYDLDNIRKRIDNYFAADEHQANLNAIVASTDKSRAEVTSMLKKLPLEMAKLGSETALNNVLKDLYSNQNISVQLQNGSIEVEMKRQEGIGEVRDLLGPVGKGLDYITNLLGGIFSGSVSYSVSSKH